MAKVIVVGGGAAGLFAAYSSAKKGNKVILIEKNEKLGKKIYISGKGRCNLTNDVDVNEFLENVNTNRKFLYSAINTFSPENTMAFFEDSGLKLKVERGNRVFPFSDKASDVTKTLEKELKKYGVEIVLNSTVKEVLQENNVVLGVKTEKDTYFADFVIICTGGISYPLTGSTGDGYIFAKKTGHNVVNPVPALCGIESKDYFCKELQGLSLKNVSLTAKFNDKVIYKDFGEMLFTHFGISGPIVLSCSCIINKYTPENLSIFIDLKPALDYNILDNRIVRELEENKVKSISSVIIHLLPKSLVSVFLKKCSLNANKKCAEITAVERKIIIDNLKNFAISVKGLRPIEEAIVTSGGVDVKQINPKTMESKIVKGLFFAGEVLDVDAFTGGFNLQCAFSTGFVAGCNT